MLIEVLKPLKVRLNDRELLLDPGRPQELADADAHRLLAKVPDKVRVISATPANTVIERASRPDGSPLSPVFWKDGAGHLCGPAIPEFLAKTGAGDREQFWIVVTYQSTIRWIRSDRLTSWKAAGGRGYRGV